EARRPTGSTVVPTPADCSSPIRYPGVRSRPAGSDAIRSTTSTRVHHACRRRGGRVAARGASAAGGDARDRLPEHAVAGHRQRPQLASPDVRDRGRDGIEHNLDLPRDEIRQGRPTNFDRLALDRPIVDVDLLDGKWYFNNPTEANKPGETDIDSPAVR